MQRDDKIIFRILKFLQPKPASGTCVLNPDMLNTDAATALAHVDWLVEKGCIRRNPKKKFPFEVMGGLTESGQRFLDEFNELNPH